MNFLTWGFIAHDFPHQNLALMKCLAMHVIAIDGSGGSYVRLNSSAFSHQL
jgi:hypothetical protein